jgi:OOP family OmpA-OmpF porin
VALALIASPYARAQDSGWYLGLNVGQSRAKIDDTRIISGLAGSGLNATYLQDHDKDTGFKVFGGYEFNKWFSLEGGYFGLGKMGYTAHTYQPGTLEGQLKLNGINLDAVLNVPLNKKFSLFGRVGVIYADAKDTFTGTGAVVVVNPSPSEKATNYKYGGGLQYDFTKSVGMRAEYERYRINDAITNKGDLDLASIGLLVRFGRTPPAVTQYTPGPERVVYLPAPYVAPITVYVPVVAKTQKYCTILDLTFEINGETIERDDLEKLAVIGTYLAKYPETTVVIEGHTDNVGTEEHNLKLSRERAQSVVDYLVENRHIDRTRLTAVGYGMSRPIADNSTEAGKRQNRRVDAVVACVTDIEGLKVNPARITMALEVEFDPKSDEVKPEHRDDLARVANFLKANPEVTATVEGHTGNMQKTEAGAMKMSQRRAENVVTYLVDNFGIARSRLSAEGFGGTRHFAYNTTLEGQQENRRVNIIINYPKRKNP